MSFLRRPSRYKHEIGNGVTGAVSQERGLDTVRLFYKNQLPKFGIVLWILVVGVLFSLLSDRFLQLQNIINIITQASIIGILSVSMTFVIITGNGGIDLSVGSIVGLTSVTMAMLVIPESFFRDTAAMLDITVTAGQLIFAAGMALLVGLAAGAINGILVANVGLPPFIATLGMMISARGVAAYVSAGMPTYGMPEQIVWLGQGRLFGVPMPIVVMVLLALIGHLVLTQTSFGVRVVAIGGNRESARFSGIRVRSVLIAVFALNGLLAGIAGLVLAGYGNQAHPDAGMLYELYTISAVVVGGTSLMGGRGAVPGSILGAILMAEVQNGINILNVPVAFMQPIVGAMIILAVVLDQVHRRVN